MNRKLLLLLQMVLIANIAHASESAKGVVVVKQSDEKYSSALYGSIRTVYGVPDLCVRLAEDLIKQPIFDGTGAGPKVSKVLPVTNWTLCCIFEIMNKNATQVLGMGKGKGWPVMLFGSGNDSLFTKSKEKIPQGLQLGIYEGIEPCHPMELGETFEKLVLKLASGWAAIKSDDIADPIKKKNPAEWNLLVKKKQELVREDALIRLLAEHLGLEKSASPHEKQHIFVEKDDSLHWWIKKDSYDTIKEAFQLLKIAE